MTYEPIRMCVACRAHRPLYELIRVTDDDGYASIDGDTRNKARGAYICRDKKCIAKAQKKHVLERHLGCTINDELYNQLEEMV